MTHTFDSEVSLHSWFLWPTVCRRRRALRGTPRRRAQRNGCLQNSNDSFQPQKQVLQSSTERFVFWEWWIRPCKIVLVCCYSDQKDFQNKSSVVHTTLQIEFLLRWEKFLHESSSDCIHKKRKKKKEKRILTNVMLV